MNQSKEDVAVPPSSCPGCSYHMDSASSADGRPVRPKPGDPSVCLKCAVALVFTDELTLRLMTVADVEALDRATVHVIARTQGAILELARRKAAH